MGRGWFGNIGAGSTLGSVALALGVLTSTGQPAAQDSVTRHWRIQAARGAIECREQQPNPSLIRAHWQTRRWMTRAEQRERRALHESAIRYRTKTYGYFAPFGRAVAGARTPMHSARGIRLFDRPIRLNEKIIPAVRCVEQEIARSCSDDYQPRSLSGIRDRNTYHNGEVSNHVYGIAIDLDPQKNTCCNCVKRWREHRLCQATPESIFQRMAMPECWVRSFEKYGFYWLGHDRLMDTMHFEFLGDPASIRIDAGD